MTRLWAAGVIGNIVFVAAFASLVGCNGRVAGEGLGGGAANTSGGGGGDPAGPGSSRTGPYRITCSVYHRDLGAGVTEHARTPLVFMSDEPAERAVELPEVDIPVRAALAPAPEAPGELVQLTIMFPRSNLEQRFRLERDRMPPYELIGFHGFTGLNYVSTPGSSVDVQFVCEASPRDEERPKPLLGPGSFDDVPPEPAEPPRPTPFRIRCDTAVDEMAKVDTDSFVLEGPTTRTLTLGGRPLELSLDDDAYWGRSFVVRFPDGLQQLYQLDRTKPVTDTTRGPGGLTGTTILRSPGGDGGASDGGASDGGASRPIVTLACGAAPS